MYLKILNEIKISIIFHKIFPLNEQIISFFERIVTENHKKIKYVKSMVEKSCMPLTY